MSLTAAAALLLLLQATGEQATLRIESQPGVSVLWEGVDLGSTDADGLLVVSEIPLGTYTIELRKEGWVGESVTLTLDPGETRLQRFLTAEGSAPAKEPETVAAEPAATEGEPEAEAPEEIADAGDESTGEPGGGEEQGAERNAPEALAGSMPADNVAKVSEPQIPEEPAAPTGAAEVLPRPPESSGAPGPESPAEQEPAPPVPGSEITPPAAVKERPAAAPVSSSTGHSPGRRGEPLQDDDEDDPVGDWGLWVLIALALVLGAAAWLRQQWQGSATAAGGRRRRGSRRHHLELGRPADSHDFIQDLRKREEEVRSATRVVEGREVIEVEVTDVRVLEDET